MVATDRLSAFDVVLPKFKGQILNQIATKFMELTQDIVNWLIATQIRV
jgi:phosphoribosylaminoimidazole-succinocarboxamide synthase